ncbi:MAG TPA: inorganic phosphate transporter [Thermoleophilia bacterium]|nr:inorganic phosphate transporter [Thermoleophilia bacterium]
MVLLVAIIVLGLAFDYTNGFHDTANAIATSVSTRALSPRMAVLMAAGFNLLGALISTNVATTVGKGIVQTNLVTPELVLAAVAGAIVWNLVTWRLGLPSSSSHALFGGLIGTMIAAVGVSGVEWKGVFDKIILPMIGSPVLGFLGAWVLMTGLTWLVRRRQQGPVNRWFRILQPFSAGFMAFSHGSNDAQKTMGIITLALVASGQIGTFAIPLWVKVACAIAMALGTYSGGWRIIHTLGSKVIKLDPIHGFAAETSAASVIQLATHFGFPVSTTHTITAAIMGVGSTQRLSAVRWGVAGNIVTAWLLTLPAAGLVGAGIYLAGEAIHAVLT